MTSRITTQAEVFGVRAFDIRRAPLAFLQRMLSVRKERIDLSRLEDHLLEDIGLTREIAKKETDRPIWDVPNSWKR